jgi:hypothetical protein
VLLLTFLFLWISYFGGDQSRQTRPATHPFQHSRSRGTSDTGYAPDLPSTGEELSEPPSRSSMLVSAHDRGNCCEENCCPQLAAWQSRPEMDQPILVFENTEGKKIAAAIEFETTYSRDNEEKARLTISRIFQVILGAYSRKPEEIAMFEKFSFRLSQDGQSLLIALLAFLFLGALLVRYL